MSNQKESLDLYAKVEDILGVKEVAPKLYSYYFNILKEIEFDSLLDIGCGDGEFLSIIDSINICSYTLGIDKSPLMIQKSLKKGVNAKYIDLKDIKEKFDLATATFDMINYLNDKEFKEFWINLSKIIKKGGYFLFDINSYYGISELAVGNFIVDDDKRFLTIESFFENNIYESYFTLFEKSNNCYKKYKGKINQYYYSPELFDQIQNWKLIKKIDIKLYEEEDFDKYILLMKRV